MTAICRSSNELALDAEIKRKDSEYKMYNAWLQAMVDTYGDAIYEIGEKIRDYAFDYDDRQKIWSDLIMESGA